MYEPKTKKYIMRTKGIGPRNLGIPKSAAKQVFGGGQDKTQEKIDKEMASDMPNARKINRLENKREVQIAKDKVKSIKTKQKIQKLQDKQSILDNPNAAG